MDNDELNGTAYVVVSNANCLYEPDVRSAVRVIPPYGTQVDVKRTDGEWALIEFCGKVAWALRSYLSNELTGRREGEHIGPHIYFGNRISRSQPSYHAPQVEYGPRGGRFVRTSSGFRRYF